MDANSNLLKLKLDMVYRDLPIEEAHTKYEAIVHPEAEPHVNHEITTVQLPAKPKVKRKTVKALVPKTK
jgi:hypothetical protein